jgi:ketosteroid isomerase-like protein
MYRRTLLLIGMGGLTAPAQPQKDSREARDLVAKAERGFAASMAQRDAARFATFLSDEAVFIGNREDQPALRGKRAVADAWKRFFDGPAAPFSWDPDVIEVLDSGKLALTSGPVKDPNGTLIGRFTSIWRIEADGQWRVVFDRGCPACKCGQ